MKIKLDVYGPEQLRLFAKYLEECAVLAESAPTVASSLGGINRIVDPLWKNHAPLDNTMSDNTSHIHLVPDAPQTQITELVYVNEPVSVLEEPEVKAAIAKRERGQPAPGRKRRTKEEIAEDEAAEKADVGGPLPPGARAGMEPEQLGIEPMTAVQAEEHFSGPYPDKPEVAAQDAADEKAEAEAASDGKLTHDDLRQAMGLYVKTYGMPAAQEDGPTIFESTLGPAPAGEKSWKLSLVPDDQGALIKAVHAWSEAVESNPFDRKAVA